MTLALTPTLTLTLALTLTLTPTLTPTLEKAGVAVNPNGKITTRHDATNQPHVYALGDVVDGSTLDPPAAG